MATFALTLTMLLQVVSSSEMNCVGFIRNSQLAAEVFVAGTNEEGTTALAVEGHLVYLNGPGLSTLRASGIYRVVRPEGALQDRGTREEMGTYFRSLATVRIERVDAESAAAVVLSTCQPIAKGDLVVPALEPGPVEFKGELSNRLTAFPAEGLSSVIILGEADLHQMATGNFCFIKVGTRDGVKPGDRFTVYRLPPPFQNRDLLVNGDGWKQSYRKVKVASYDPRLIAMLRERNLPPRPIGDIVVVEAGETSAAARVVNSLVEIELGDVVVRR